ncbi:MAG: HypC/HybG/HupF family hydrogenase formation chaperone [Phycisphaerae bacterium]|nr:HypC/HybG/HupF family hydrogenase formation chaperone [Phycisphaerae bacterium]
MCLAVPTKIETIEGNRGTGVLAGNRITILLDLVPEVKVDDWVLMHAGFAITVLTPEDAKATLDILSEML